MSIFKCTFQQRIVSWVNMVSGANARRNVEEGLKPEQEKSANKLKTTARPVDNNP